MADWFEEHAPTQQGGDWFAANRPPDFKTETTATESGFGSFLTGSDNKPSVLGFGENVLTSGVQFARSLLSPVLHPQATHEGAMAAWRNPGLTAQSIKDAVIKRYGSVDAFLSTLYTDPVGAASDASMALGGVAAATKGAGLTKLARITGGAAEALNPLAIPAKTMDKAGRAAYAASINPSRRIRRGFPGAIEKGYEMNALPTEGGLNRAENKLEASAANTQDLLQQADAAGAPGVSVKAQVVPNLKEPAIKAQKRYRLGKPDERIDVSEKAKNLAKRNAQPIPLTEANKLKQEAQSLADTAYRQADKGALIKDIDALGDMKVAEAFRKAIEHNAMMVGVDGIQESNKQTQALIGLAQALEDATQQPSRLTHLMSTLGAVGGGLAGGPAAGGAAYVAGRVATAKPVMAISGLLVGKSNAVVRNAQILRALAVLKASANGEGAAKQGQQRQ